MPVLECLCSGISLSLHIPDCNNINVMYMCVWICHCVRECGSQHMRVLTFLCADCNAMLVGISVCLYINRAGMSALIRNGMLACLSGLQNSQRANELEHRAERRYYTRRARSRDLSTGMFCSFINFVSPTFHLYLHLCNRHFKQHSADEI